MCLADYEVARGIAGGHLRSMLRRKPSRRPALVRLAAAAVVLVALLALAGCGDSDDGAQITAPAVTDSSGSAQTGGTADSAASNEPDGDPANDRAKITDTLTAVLSGSDSAQICGTLLTERYLKKAYGDAAGCKKAQNPKAAADKLDISEISISPEAVASTSVRAKGGVYDGEQLKVALVLQDGDWKLDSLDADVPVGP